MDRNIERLLERRWGLLNDFGRGAFADGQTREAIKGIEADLAKHDLFPCHACRTIEHIELLDAKPDDPNNPEACNWERFECVACYGPGWGTNSRDFSESVAPQYKPLYDAWRATESVKQDLIGAINQNRTTAQKLTRLHSVAEHVCQKMEGSDYVATASDKAELRAALDATTPDAG